MLRGLKVPPDWPKDDELVRMLVDPPAPGSWKLVWLSTLNASARNCRFTRSVTLMFLNREVSQETKLGPTKVLRPRLPTQAKHGELKKPFGLGPLPLNTNPEPQPSAH